MKALLLVTWFVGAATPDSYQVAFEAMETCQAAARQLQEEQGRLGAEAEAKLAERSNLPTSGVVRTTASNVLPTVSALCVKQ